MKAVRAEPPGGLPELEQEPTLGPARVPGNAGRPEAPGRKAEAGERAP